MSNILSGTIKGSVGGGGSLYISKVVFKDTSDQFPENGNPNYLYIATAEEAMFCWRDAYIPLSGRGGEGGGSGEISINDTIISAYYTWSSQKINSELNNKAEANSVYTTNEIDEKLAKLNASSEHTTSDDIYNLFE